MKKLLSVIALVVAVATPMAQANAVAPMPPIVTAVTAGSVIPFAIATGMIIPLTYAIATNVDPWTPLAHDLFGAEGRVEYSYPSGR